MADEQRGESPRQQWPRSSRRQEGPRGEVSYKSGPYPAGPYPYGYQVPVDEQHNGRFSVGLLLFLIAAGFFGAAVAFFAISLGTALLS